jgi:hypothetical protein
MRADWRGVRAVHDQADYASRPVADHRVTRDLHVLCAGDRVDRGFHPAVGGRRRFRNRLLRHGDDAALSQYFVYLLTAGFFAKLGHSLWYGWQSGFFDFQFGSMQEIARSLAPSAVLAVLSLGCCWLVYRHFHGVRSKFVVAA